MKKALMLLLVLGLLIPQAIPNISVTLTVDNSSVYVGDEIVVTVNVTNTRDEPIKNVTIKRYVPSGFSLVANDSRKSFVQELKPNESIVLTVKIKAESKGEFRLEPVYVTYVYDGQVYKAYSNRVKINVYDRIEKETSEAVNTSVKYAAIAAGLSALGLAVALIIRRPRKPRAI